MLKIIDFLFFCEFEDGDFDKEDLLIFLSNFGELRLLDKFFVVWCWNDCFIEEYGFLLLELDSWWYEDCFLEIDWGGEGVKRFGEWF